MVVMWTPRTSLVAISVQNLESRPNCTRRFGRVHGRRSSTQQALETACTRTIAVRWAARKSQSDGSLDTRYRTVYYLAVVLVACRLRTHVQGCVCIIVCDRKQVVQIVPIGRSRAFNDVTSLCGCRADAFIQLGVPTTYRVLYGT